MERFEYVALTTNEILKESISAESQTGQKRLSVRVVRMRKLKEMVLNRLSIAQTITIASEARRGSSNSEAGHRKLFPGFASLLRSRCGQFHKFDE